MTTKTDTEQLRADFEAWASQYTNYPQKYDQIPAWQAYQAGRAALQSQVKSDTTLFCDLKTDEEKSSFFLTGRGYETGVIAQAIQNDVAMAYHRCSEYRKELEALQSQDREDAERYRYLVTKLQQAYDGDYIEIGPMSLYCHMQSQFKGDRVIRAEITWGDETGESIGLSEAIDHARHIEGEAK